MTRLASTLNQSPLQLDRFVGVDFELRLRSYCVKCCRKSLCRLTVESPCRGIRENSGGSPAPNSHEFGYTDESSLWGHMLWASSCPVVAVDEEEEEEELEEENEFADEEEVGDEDEEEDEFDEDDFDDDFDDDFEEDVDESSEANLDGDDAEDADADDDDAEVEEEFEDDL